MKVESIIQHYHDLEIEINRIRMEQAEDCEQIAEIVCPHKIGDIVEIKGYSFAGKKGIITKRIIGKYYNNRLRCVVYAKVLKKDGTESLNGADWAVWKESK